MFELNWGYSKKKNQAYPKRPKTRKSRMIAMLKPTTGKTKKMNFVFKKNKFGFKTNPKTKVEITDLNMNDPDTNKFISVSVNTFNEQPDYVRNSIKKITLGGSRKDRLATFVDDEFILRLYKPDKTALPVNQYSQIIRHEMDHAKLSLLMKKQPKKFLQYQKDIKSIPPATVVTYNIYNKLLNDSLSKQKTIDLSYEYFQEMFAETGQYIEQKKHGFPMYNILNEKSMRNAVRFYKKLSNT